jgi:hypothetical protein
MSRNVLTSEKLRFSEAWTSHVALSACSGSRPPLGPTECVNQVWGVSHRGCIGAGLTG